MRDPTIVYLTSKLPREAWLERFEPDLNTGCWLWNGSLNFDGYGCARDNGRKIGAHRLFYERFKGPIPSGMLVCHRCDTPACVNPNHLFLGTFRDNAQDASEKGRMRTSERQGSLNQMAKLTESMVREIWLDVGKHREIAAKYGVSTQAIASIKQRRFWTHVTDFAGPRGESQRSREGRVWVPKKLTADLVVAIRSDARTYKEISADYGIAISAISAVKNRKSWAHVP